LFSLPVSNAELERFFSTLKRVKTPKRASLSQSSMEDIFRIKLQGPPLEEYDPFEAVLAWHAGKA